MGLRYHPPKCNPKKRSMVVTDGAERVSFVGFSASEAANRLQTNGGLLTNLPRYEPTHRLEKRGIWRTLRDGGELDGTMLNALENRCTPCGGPKVRIPPSPPTSRPLS